MNKEILKYEMSNFKGIKSMIDFYDVLGIEERLQAGEITVMDVFMEREDCEELQNFMRKNFPGRKHYTEKYINANVAMEWLNYSPSSTIQPPKGEIWIIKQEDRKEYEKMVEEAVVDGLKNKKGEEEAL